MEAQLNGAFDFNRIPLAPPGTKALIYESSSNRRTWAPHGFDSWYLGPAPEHYRCYRLYVPKTRAERTAKIVQFFPHRCLVPKTSSIDAAIITARALTAFGTLGEGHDWWLLGVAELGNGAAGFGLVSASVRARAAMMAASTEDVLGTGHWCGKNCTVLAVRSALVLGT